MEPRAWPSGDGVALAAWGNFFVSALIGPMVPARLDRIVAASDDVLASFGPFVNVTQAPDRVPMPDKAYREYSHKVVGERAEDTTLTTVLVLEGKGFWLATARMVVAGIERFSSALLEVEESIAGPCSGPAR